MTDWKSKYIRKSRDHAFIRAGMFALLFVLVVSNYPPEAEIWRKLVAWSSMLASLFFAVCELRYAISRHLAWLRHERGEEVD